MRIYWIIVLVLLNISQSGVPTCRCSGEESEIGRGADCVNLYQKKLWCYTPDMLACKDSEKDKETFWDPGENKSWSFEVCNEKYRGFLCIDDQKKLLPPVGLNCTKLELEGKCEDLLTDIWKSIGKTGAPEKVKVLDVCIESCKQCVGSGAVSMSIHSVVVALVIMIM